MTKKKEEKRDYFAELSAQLPKSAYHDVKFGRGYTSIDAYHIVARMTEIFGLCGDGWGFGESPKFDIEGSGNLSCESHIWYMKGDKKCVIHSIGDAQIIKSNVAEAKKKAQTNMLSKATSFLGIGLSVYQGMGVDDPYLDRQHTAEGQAKPAKKSLYKYNIVSIIEKDAVSEFIEAQALEVNFMQSKKGDDMAIVISNKPIKKFENYLMEK